MLSTTTGGASQSPANADAAAAKSTKIEGLKTAVKVKAEPFSTLSPENSSNQNQTMSDEADAPAKNPTQSTNNNNNNNTNSNNNNNNNNNNNSSNNSSKNTNPNTSCGSNIGASGPSEVSGTGVGCSTAGALRQNSSNSINSPPNGKPNANPNNASDQSNTNSSSSSKVSAGLTQIVDGDLHQDELLKKKKGNAKEDECAKSTHATTSGNLPLEKASQNSSAVASGNTKVGSVNAAAVAVKEEPADLLGSLVNMKKEDNFSPSMSPVGFGSIGSIGGPSGGSAPDRTATPVKMELSSNITEKTPSVMGLNSDDIVGCNTLVNSLDTDRMSDTTSSNSNVAGGGSVGGPTGSGTGLGVSLGIGINVSPGASNFMGSNNSVGGALGNCLDYMQQQNHIFVFSTQLANNGAESVLSGQFQTIIAYHCTQPATKSFLEDFFMKNPMKMNKLQRQNSLGLGICNMPGPGGGQTWLNANANSNNNMSANLNTNPNPNLAKMLQPQQKAGVPGGPKSHFNNQADNINKQRNTFADPSPADSLVNDSDLMCWETGNAGATVNRNSLEGAQGAADAQALKLMEGVESVVSVLGKCNSDLSADNNIISLQGVKVPDENLTPQQRQHREEQLAKIKKMNQFLFPENDSGANQLNKLSNDSAMGNIMMNMPGASNAQMRQMQMQMQAAQKSDHMQLGEDVLMPMPLPTDVIGEIGAVMSCNSGPQKNNLPCGPPATSSTTAAATGGPVAGPGSGGMNVNMNVGMQCSNNPNLMTNSPEIMSGFGNTNCVMGLGVGQGAGDKGGIANQDGMPMPQGGMTPMEWTKMQQQFFEERLKVGKVGCRPAGMPGHAQVLGPGPGPGPGSGVQQPPLAAGSGSNAGGSVNASNPGMRNNAQGPPPPYHPTQRSASVPIATQSPNPSSPNNLSLPSPRTAGALGLPSNSPSMELSTANPSASAAPTSTMGAITTSKNCFQNDGGSPSSRHRSGGNATNVMNHHLNSNPSTPLAHLSPKEIEPFNSTPSGGELKSTRPSPQRPRSPGSGNANPNSANHLIEPNNMDSRFPASSPGLNFNVHTQMQNNPNTAMNTYKGPNGNNPLEVNRQNCGSGGPPVQFARRSDNMPLNPNSSNRPAQNKMTQNFDPISSLAQMSQQLTSCVSGVGSPAGGMNMMGPGPVDMNMEHGGMVPNLDAQSMDHMSHTPGGNAPNNCHPINPLINSMGQRMLNPKMAGIGSGFSPGPNGVVRDGPGGPVGPGFHGILPSGPRMNRVPVNFGPNFNPNIQVKASTPNTIQYMPVRPQNNNHNNGNNNGNVRMAPSLEFLQRYANPQMANSVGVPPIGHGIGNDGGPMMIGAGGPMNMNSPNEQQQSKMGNNHSGNGINMNFFQNCNQLPGLDDEGGAVGVGVGVGGVGLTGHDMNISQTPMIRGMRPHGMRQHGGLGIRMQAPGVNIVNRQQGQFPTPDGLDCNDPSVMFNNGAGSCNTSPAMFAASQQGQPKGQHLKSMPGGMCQTQVAPNVGMQGPGAIHVQGQGHPVMSGPNNSNLISSAGNGGGSGGGIGVNFVGPSSNDLKYAQQYHSFQQQLYATNTRSQQQQQQQQQGGGNMIAMPPNLSPNPAFFVNK